MKRAYLLCTLMLTLLGSADCFSQDFSNKGKEFWLAYCYHVGMAQNGFPVMTVYITSDVNTTYKVEIFGGATIQSGNITAGQVISVVIPTTYFINAEGIFNNKAIRVSADKPVVVYSYITRSAVSGATVCLPTNVLGKEYYAMSFTQISNEANSNSYFTIIAVEDNTSVEITPSGNTKNGQPANVPFTVNLNKGQIYQVLGALTGNSGVDLSGSKIKSVSSGSGGCQRIAVYSGTGKVSIGCAAASSSDNLYQQLYPVASWGKKFLTIPSYNRPTNFYRVAKSNVGANVYVNGTLIPSASFINNIYYQFSSTTPNKIESDLPISVTQYFTTQACSGNGVPYDPDMIVLNPVEQNIDKVTLVSSNLVAANPQHHLHVIMRNGGSGISSFKLDNNLVSPSSWVIHPQDATYSYLYLNNVSQGYHTLASDSGFNALAYGYADAESYGYSAGANVKDLYQFVTVKNQYATVNFPAACKNSPFYFSMTFPYQPTQIQWKFGAALNAIGIADVTISSPVADSTWSVNGKQLYRYNLPSTYSIGTSGIYPITVLAQNPTSDGCSGEQEINYDLQVFDPPVAGFGFLNNGCVTNSVQFTPHSNTTGRPFISWSWNFGDGSTSSISNPNHTYTAPGSYNVKYSLITDVGCLSDTASQMVTLTDLPVSKFSVSAPYCAGKAITFTDESTITGAATLTKWTWNFGDGSPVITALTNAPQTHTYASTGTYNATLVVETATGCASVSFLKPVIISPNPVADFNLPAICLPVGNAQFNSSSTISDGTQNLFTYAWDFGDGGTGTGQNPTHNYSGTGPFTVKLTVTSNNGCTANTQKILNTVYPEPQAAFNAPPEVCLGTSASFIDASTVAGSSITQWSWDFGDGILSTQQNPVKTFAAAGTFTVKLNVTSAFGCQTVNKFATKTIIVNPLPTADFNFSSPACEKGIVTFSDASIANAGSLTKWTWDFADGSNAVLNNVSPFSHVFSNAGSYNVTLVTETSKGCISNIKSKQVVINPVPMAGFISPEVCLTDPAAPFSDTSRIASGTIIAWNWNFGDAGSNSLNTSTLQNPSHLYTATGSYTASLIVTSNSGCKDTVTQNFTVNGSIPQAGFTIQNSNTLCSNQTVSIKDGSIVDFGSLVKIEIYWDYSNDPTINTIDDNPVPGKIYTHTYPEFGTPVTKTYSIRYVAYSGINCVNVLTKTITVLATPALQFSVIDPVCSADPSFQITQAQLTNGLPGAGVFSGKGISSNGIFNPAQAGLGTHMIRYTYTATNSCINYIEQSVVVNPTPGANAGPDKTVLEGGVVTLTPAVNASLPVTYLWTPSTGLADPTKDYAVASPADDITYTLTVTTDKGCQASDKVFVKVLRAPVIPNIFSPNGDGVHDKLEIAYLESYPGCIIDIYNRYGQLIFHSIGYSQPWDGTIKGKPAPIGTYYYIIDPKNGRKKVGGYVDIIR